jgi:hypothetical protein
VIIAALLQSSCAPTGSVHGENDHTGPDVAITGLTDGQQIQGPVTFGYSASDAESTVSTVSAKVNGVEVRFGIYHSFNVTDAAGFSPNTPGDFVITVEAKSDGGTGTATLVVHYDGT